MPGVTILPVAAIGAYWKTEQNPDAHTVRMLEALAQSSASAIVYAQKLETQARNRASA